MEGVWTRHPPTYSVFWEQVLLNCRQKTKTCIELRTSSNDLYLYNHRSSSVILCADRQRKTSDIIVKKSHNWPVRQLVAPLIFSLIKNKSPGAYEISSLSFVPIQCTVTSSRCAIVIICTCNKYKYKYYIDVHVFIEALLKTKIKHNGSFQMVALVSL